MDADDFKKDHEFIDPLWRLADTLTVVQAAALIAGFEPNAVRFDHMGRVYFEDERGATDSTFGSSVKTAYEALKNAINSGKLKAKIVHDSRPIDRADRQTLFDMMEIGEYANPSYDEIADDDEHVCNHYFVKNNPNWEKSFVVVDDLREWLLCKGFRTGFFFPDLTDAPDYLDKNNPRYAPKLAAAIKAWEAMEDDNLRSGKSAKAAMEQWLTSNYKMLELVHKRNNEKFGFKIGDLNKSAIEEAAKIANWELCTRQKLKFLFGLTP